MNLWVSKLQGLQVCLFFVWKGLARVAFSKSGGRSWSHLSRSHLPIKFCKEIKLIHVKCEGILSLFSRDAFNYFEKMAASYQFLISELRLQTESETGRQLFHGLLRRLKNIIALKYKLSIKSLSLASVCGLERSSCAYNQVSRIAKN